MALRGRPVTRAWGLNVDEPTEPARSLQEPPPSCAASSQEARASDFSSLFLRSLFSFRRNWTSSLRQSHSLAYASASASKSARSRCSFSLLLRGNSQTLLPER